MDARVSVRRVVAWLLVLHAGASSAQGFDPAHAAWDALLKRYVVVVSGGKASQLDYAGMARDRTALKAYLETLARVSEPEFDGWTKPQRVAFLVNAYNAFTVEKVLTRYPDIRSIWDFGKIFGNPFRDEFFTLFGRRFTLDGIEHGLLRKPGAYDEPRVHYAVNCASVGCPMLREEAYVAGRLGAQLDEQERRFLSDRSRNRFNPQTGRLEVSRIFDWFKEDWSSGYRGYDGGTPPIGSRTEYFARHAALLADDPRDRERIAARKADIGFLDYDWTLNDVQRR
jgi:hypothetical protein